MLVQCKEERYVLHRVLRREGEEFFLRGDAQEQREGPFIEGDVLGKVVVSYRNGSCRVMDRGPWHFARRDMGPVRASGALALVVGSPGTRKRKGDAAATTAGVNLPRVRQALPSGKLSCAWLDRLTSRLCVRR